MIGNVSRSISVNHGVSRETMKDIEKDISDFFDYLTEEYALEVESEESNMEMKREVESEVQPGSVSISYE